MLALIVLIAFPILIWQAYQKVRLSRASAAWPVAPGLITAAERIKVAWRLQPRVTYTYQVDGKTFSSNRISFAAVVPASETEPVLSRYQVNVPVHVHYQPGNPAVAILEPGPNRQVSLILRQYIIWFAVVILVNVIYIAVSVWSAHDDAASDGQPTRTYDDAARDDPGLGDRLLREAADKGNAKDQVYVAVWYLTGQEGYPKDPAEGAKWLQKAADQGDAEGENMLGQLYARGHGVPKDLHQAVQWFQKAADQNEPHACANLGFAYEKGLGGMPQDTQKAIDWYRKAGDEPNARAALARLGASP